MRCLFIFFFCLQGLVCSLVKADEVPDSLLTFERLREMSISNPRGALTLIDKAEQEKRLSDFDINTLRQVSYDGLKMNRLALKYAKRVLESEEVELNPERGLDAYMQIAIYSVSLSNYEEAINFAVKGGEIAHKYRNLSVEANLFSVIGDVKKQMGLLDDSYLYYQKAIDLLKGSNNPRELSMLSYFYGTLMTAYMDNHLLEKAIEIGEIRRELIARLAGMEGPPESYIDRQYGYLYSKMAYAYILAGDKKSAESYFLRFLQTSFAMTNEGRTEANPYLLKVGRNSDVLSNNKELERTLVVYGDTLNEQFLILLKENRDAYQGMGNYRMAFDTQKRISNIADSIYVSAKNCEALEMATIYETNEKDMQLQEQGANLRIRKIVLVSMSIVILLLILLLWRMYIHTRVVHGKNLVLAKNVDELLDSQQKLQIERKRNIELLQQLEQDADSSGKDAACDLCDDRVPDNQRLFNELNQLILDDKLYLNSTLSRDDLAQLIHVNKNRFAEIIQESTGTRLNEYLNGLRIEHAIYLMKQFDNYTLQAIAVASGFSNMSTFHSLFKKKIGMTPSQYWDILKQGQV